VLATLLALALAAPADPPKEKELSAEAKKELKKLEGKWKVAKLGVNGQERTLGPDDRELAAEIKDGKWIFTGVEKAEIVAIDPTTEPKCIDFKSVEKGRAGTVDEAIYKIDGDTLTIALYQGKGKQRPANFDTPKDAGTILVVLNRVKEQPVLATLLALSLTASADPPKEKELSAEAKQVLKKLEGRWKLVKEVRAEGEKEFTDEAITIEFKGRTVCVDTVAKLEFTLSDLDPTTDPKLLDLTCTKDAGPVRKGDVLEAIYKIDGDTLTIALYKLSGKRPANFDTPKDAEATVVTFKRIKE
jgi:uncharacterized protein (TIGR03067 family)